MFFFLVVSYITYVYFVECFSNKDKDKIVFDVIMKVFPEYSQGGLTVKDFSHQCFILYGNSTVLHKILNKGVENSWFANVDNFVINFLWITCL